MSDETFQSWCVLELMGHRRLTGHVSEQTIAGAQFLRLDVFETGADKPKATQFYRPESVYCITPTTEEAARREASPYRPPALVAPAPSLTCADCGSDDLGFCNYCTAPICMVCGECACATARVME